MVCLCEVCECMAPVAGPLNLLLLRLARWLKLNLLIQRISAQPLHANAHVLWHTPNKTALSPFVSLMRNILPHFTPIHFKWWFVSRRCTRYRGSKRQSCWRRRVGLQISKNLLPFVCRKTLKGARLQNGCLRYVSLTFSRNLLPYARSKTTYIYTSNVTLRTYYS